METDYEPHHYWKLGYYDARDYDTCNPPEDSDSKKDYIEGYGDGMDANLKVDFSPEAIALDTLIKRIDWEYEQAKENWLNEGYEE